jgi:hypothetical protein
MSQQTHDTGAATTMRSARINGASGAGFIEMVSQVSAPNTPVGGTSVYIDGNNNPSWKIPSGFTVTLDTKNITANRIYEFPNSSGMVVTESNISNYIPIATTTTAGIVVGSAAVGNLITSLGTDIAPGLTTNDAGFNTAVGTHALFSAVPSPSTLENTSIGAYSLYNLTTGRANTALGESSGAGGTNAFYNTFLGYNARTSKADCFKSIVIGHDAVTSVDNEFAIADTITQMKMVGLGSAADGAGTLLAIDSNGVIKKAGGTNNTVAAIDTAITGGGGGVKLALGMSSSVTNTTAFQYESIFWDGVEYGGTTYGSTRGGDNTPGNYTSWISPATKLYRFDLSLDYLITNADTSRTVSFNVRNSNGDEIAVRYFQLTTLNVRSNFSGSWIRPMSIGDYVSVQLDAGGVFEGGDVYNRTWQITEIGDIPA